MIQYEKLPGKLAVMSNFVRTKGGFIVKISNEFTLFRKLEAFLPASQSFIPRGFDLNSPDAFLICTIVKVNH